MKSQPYSSALLRILALATLIATPPTHATPALTFGIVPQQAATKLARLWSPLLAAVGECSDLQLQFRTAPNIPTFEKRLDQGGYDIAYMNPYHYVVFSQRVGYSALAKQANKQIRGVIVVNADSPITRLEELNGAELSFPAPAAFAASVLPRAALRARKLTFSPRYVSSHDSVYKSVAKRLFVAGGGIERTLTNIDSKTRGQLRILWRTRGYTPHAIATSPRMSETVRATLLACMTQLSATRRGRKLLSAIKFSAIEAASDKDWDDVRQLGLNQTFGKREPGRAE